MILYNIIIIIWEEYNQNSATVEAMVVSFVLFCIFKGIVFVLTENLHNYQVIPNYYMYIYNNIYIR